MNGKKYIYTYNTIKEKCSVFTIVEYISKMLSFYIIIKLSHFRNQTKLANTTLESLGKQYCETLYSLILFIIQPQF